MADNEVIIQIKGDLKDLKIKLEGVKTDLQEVGRTGGRSFDNLTNKVEKFAKAIAGAFVIKKFIGFLKDSVIASEKQAQAELFLARSLKNVKTEVGNNLPMLKELARKYQELTGIGDETILGFAGMLSTFQLNSQQIAQLIPRILDMGKAYEMTTGRQADYNSIAIAVGKAIQGQTGVLARYGVVLDEEALKTDKFNGILKSLDDNFKGAAETAGQTFTGSLDKVKSGLGDLKEVIGKFVKEGLKPYVKLLGKIVGWLNEVADSFQILHKYEDSALARYEKAQKEVNRLIKEGKTDTKEYKRALIALKIAKREYYNELKKAVEKQREMKKAMQESKKTAKDLEKELEALRKKHEKETKAIKLKTGAYLHLNNVIMPEYQRETEETAEKTGDTTDKAKKDFEKFAGAVSKVSNQVVSYMQRIKEGEEVTLGEVVKDLTKLVAQLLTYYAIVSETGSTALGSAGSELVGEIFNLIGFQEGGVVDRPTLALVGEKEREYIIPETKMATLLKYMERNLARDTGKVEVVLKNVLTLEDFEVKGRIYRAIDEYGREIGKVTG